MDQIRSFIAIELPEIVRVNLTQLEDSLKAACPFAIKWVNPDNIHLTLKFLGNIETTKIEAIIGAMSDALTGVSPFILNLANLGVFPNLKNIQVVWIGLGGDLGAMQNIQNQIELNLVPLGFPLERRPFTAHLTLARVTDNVSYAEKQALARVISKTETSSDISFKVDSVNLIKSQLARTGAIYSRLSLIEIKSSCQ